MLKTGMYDSGFHRCRFERKKNMDPAQNIPSGMYPATGAIVPLP